MVCVVKYVVVWNGTTPWDNSNGWLGVKHQITYLLEWYDARRGAFWNGVVCDVKWYNTEWYDVVWYGV